MKNYELKIRLKYLTLVGQNDDGELEWLGSAGNWGQTTYEIEEYEMING